ncbi:hypothetical protein [Streptomyces sp. NPDC059262]|uniref:hypothetical protein n=1 Tax=Streptomyces sp. NPDC059262 TaxID=3346797 RepID=UPI0036B6630B
MRTSARRTTDRVRGIAVGQGAAALLAAAGLLVTAMPAAHADTDTPAAASSVSPGDDTDTPSLVTGLNESADASASAADAAREHLAGKKGRYHIADAKGDLKAVSTEDAKGGLETVRLQQKYKGVSVLGGEYVVRMTKKDGKRTVTGTSGKYFTQVNLTRP